jgi:hypothetical protein
MKPTTNKDDPRQPWHRPRVWREALRRFHHPARKWPTAWQAAASFISEKANLGRTSIEWRRNGHGYTMKIGELITSKRELADAVFGKRGGVMLRRKSIQRLLTHLRGRDWLIAESLKDQDGDPHPNDGLRLILTVPIEVAAKLASHLLRLATHLATHPQHQLRTMLTRV